MGNSLHISFDINRTTLLSLGLSAAAHIAAICGLATMVVTPSQTTLGSAANSSLALDIPLHPDQTKPTPPPPATQQDLERLLAKLPQPEKAKPEEPAEDFPLTLGVDDGNANTKVWIGGKEATEHHAPKSVVDQSALTRDAGNPGEAAPQTPQLDPSVEQQSLPSGVERTDATEQQAVENKGSADRGEGKDAAERQRREAQEALTELKSAPGTSMLTATIEFLQRLARVGANGAVGEDDTSRERKDEVKVSVEAHVGARTKEREAPSKAGSQGADDADEKRSATPATSGGDRKLPGFIDEGESEGASITDPIDLIVNGKVQAAKGLRIRTVQAEFSTTTRLTARPRSPQVLITFNRAGKVVRATFTPGRSTGFEDVDQPLLNSIYRWTAKGETLLKLSATNPRAELTITVNILFQ